MKLNRILCPIDYSKFSDAANYYASFLAEATNAEIVFVNIADLPTAGGDIDQTLDDIYMELSTRIRPMIHELRHEFEVSVGDPATEIVRLANKLNIDLIVMGTHGRTGVSHLVYGSVCEKVLRNATCPVMAVKSEQTIGWMLPSEETSTRSNDDR